MEQTLIKAMREGYGDAMPELGRLHEDIVVLDGDLACATGANCFAGAFPARFFNIGIAEQNLAGIAAGFAHTGMVPFASSFAMFLCGRAFEVVRNAICYTNANVKLIGTHAGITAVGDGGSHQSIEDLAIMCALPNMTVFSPADYHQMKVMLSKAYEIQGPVYLRTSRAPAEMATAPDQDITPGKAQVMAEGKDICIVACGMQVRTAQLGIKLLEQKGVRATLLNLHTIKPLDTETIGAYAKQCGRLLVIEEHNVVNGVGAMIAKHLLGKTDVAFDVLGIEDRFGQSARSVDAIFTEYGFTADNVYNRAMRLLEQ